MGPQIIGEEPCLCKPPKFIQTVWSWLPHICLDSRLQKFPQSIQTGGQGWQKTSTIHQKSQKIEINFQGPYKAKIALESTYNLHGYIIQSITTPNDVNHWPQPPEQPYFPLKLQRPWVQPSTSPCIANEGQSCVLYSMKTKSWCPDTKTDKY